MTDVVLLYDRDCPNVPAARAALLRAFSEASVPARWRELDRGAPGISAAWRALGSPAVLVDGEDVAGAPSEGGACCRVYATSKGLSGAPSVEAIAARLRPAVAAPASRGLGSTFALPGVLLALLPKGLCPACWPAYAAALSALGLGFLMQTRYLLPLTALALVVATSALAFRARLRRGYGPAALGAAAGAALLLGKYALGASWVADPAMVVFGAAAVWNAWPRRRAVCGACVAP
ncbi:MAG: hypothetical protein HY909_26765 [Deltaproteobacteria bacterium]|nr:hypothetical protein [Deltaproteobacteria bacterium]